MSLLDKSKYRTTFHLKGSCNYAFPLILNKQYILLIFTVCLIILIVAGLYPSIKAARLNPIEAIGIKK